MPQSPHPAPQSGQPDKPEKNRRWFVVAFVVVTLAVSGISLWSNLSRMFSADPAVARAPDPAEAKLVIETARGRQIFDVDVMRTDAERAKGLMFRKSMPDTYGMLFDFQKDQHIAMWMKNTYIPLDMLFIKADGRIHRIEQRTEPHSEKTISSGEAVRAVLEINGGLSEKIGLKAGDKVIHRMFPAK